MTQKLKKLSIISLLLSAFVIFSCSEDYEVHDHNHNESKIKVKPITIKDVSTNARALEKLTNPKSRFKTNSSTDRIINDTINNFSIDTDYGLYIEDGDYHSYTFKITRPNGSNYLLENVVVSKKNDTEYETILYQYNITEQELEMIDDGDFVNLEGKMNKIFLENSIITSEVTGKYYFNGSCYEDNPVYVAGNTCPSGQHDLNFILSNMGSDDQCEYYLNGTYTATAGHWTWQSTLVPCDDAGGGGVGGTSSYSGGFGGTGGVTTSPVNNCKTCIAPYIPDPCDKVKNLLLLNPDITTKLQQLDTQTSSTSEHGAFLLNNGTGVQNLTASSSGEIELVIPSNGILIFLAHTHNSPSNSTYSVFSWEDMEGIAELLKRGNIDANQFVTFLMTADGTRYAFTIDDTNAFLSFFAQIGDPLFSIENERKNAATMEKFYGYNNGIVNTIPDALIKVENTDLIKDEKNFLKIIKKNKIGITLLEVDNTFTNFEKVKLNFFNSITKQPCN